MKPRAANEMDACAESCRFLSAQPVRHFCCNRPGSPYDQSRADHSPQKCFPPFGRLVREYDAPNSALLQHTAALGKSERHCVLEEHPVLKGNSIANGVFLPVTSHQLQVVDDFLFLWR